MAVHVETDWDGIPGELDRLAAGPVPFAGEFEAVLMGSFAITQARVHVITGALKASGRPSSEFDGEVWRATIAYARHPGIFELARGDHPTANHPEGGHFFFDPPEGDEYWRRRYEDVFFHFLGASGHGGVGA